MSDLGCEVVTLESGVRAMRDAQTGEIMHPGVGPRIEAEALYVAPSRLRERLGDCTRAPLVVLDVGLGAGSNAVAALRAAAALPVDARVLELVSFERTLVPLEVAIREEHAEAFGYDAERVQAARTLLEAHAYEGVRTRWRLRLGDLEQELAQQPATSADVVFWDPYSPRSNPALWSVAIFRALRRTCREGATVHTYSAATATRTALLLAGFYVGLGPRSGRKQKPTTIAATRLDDLATPLPRAWLTQLAEARVPLASDAPRDALSRLSAHPQFRPSRG